MSQRSPDVQGGRACGEASGGLPNLCVALLFVASHFWVALEFLVFETLGLHIGLVLNVAVPPLVPLLPVGAESDLLNHLLFATPY